MQQQAVEEGQQMPSCAEQSLKNEGLNQLNEEDFWINQFFMPPEQPSLELSQNKTESFISQIFKPKNKNAINNLQKHTVITFKRQINIDCSSEDIVQQTSYELWNTFLKTQKKIKQSMLIIFGRFDETSAEDKKLFESLNLDASILANPEIIRIAQDSIRSQAIEQLTEHKLRKHIEKRRIHNKEAFVKHMLKFLQKLQSSPIKRRKINNNHKKLDK